MSRLHAPWFAQHGAAMVDWLAGDESRIGLGCMRLSTEQDRDEEKAVATVHAALDAGATVFDTGRASASIRRALS